MIKKTYCHPLPYIPNVDTDNHDKYYNNTYNYNWYKYQLYRKGIFGIKCENENKENQEECIKIKQQLLDCLFV